MMHHGIPSPKSHKHVLNSVPPTWNRRRWYNYYIDDDGSTTTTTTTASYSLQSDLHLLQLTLDTISAVAESISTLPNAAWATWTNTRGDTIAFSSPDVADQASTCCNISSNIQSMATNKKQSHRNRPKADQPPNPGKTGPPVLPPDNAAAFVAKQSNSAKSAAGCTVTCAKTTYNYYLPKISSGWNPHPFILGQVIVNCMYVVISCMYVHVCT